MAFYTAPKMQVRPRTREVSVLPLLKPEPFVEGLVNRLAKKRKRATFELSREEFHGEGTEIVKLYDEEGTVLGQIVFAQNPDGSLDLQVLTVNDWSEEAASVERLLKFLERAAAKRKAKVLHAELYMSDAKTTEKIEQMKAHGWQTQDVGRMGQRASYTLTKRLGRA